MHPTFVLNIQEKNLTFQLEEEREEEEILKINNLQKNKEKINISIYLNMFYFGNPLF